MPSILAVVYSDGSMALYMINSENPNATPDCCTLPAAEGITCLSWSPKGKQLVAGKYYWFTIHSHFRYGSLFSHMLSVRISIPTFQNLAKQNKVKTMFATDETESLAKWIIDDTLVLLKENFAQMQITLKSYDNNLSGIENTIYLFTNLEISFSYIWISWFLTHSSSSELTGIFR